MIGYLAGIIKEKEINQVIVDVRGVGYQVKVPFFIAEQLALNDQKSFFIHTHVREDEISLYGFVTKDDKNIFEQLLTVSGIGPKIALKIISAAGSSQKIVKAISEADVDFFLTVKGVGKKSSQRIIVDLKSKIGGLKELEFEQDQDQDLIMALKGLGFSHEEIRKATKGIKKDLPLEEKIKLALRKNN